MRSNLKYMGGLALLLAIAGCGGAPRSSFSDSEPAPENRQDIGAGSTTSAAQTPGESQTFLLDTTQAATESSDTAGAGVTGSCICDGADDEGDDELDDEGDDQDAADEGDRHDSDEVDEQVQDEVDEDTHLGTQGGDDLADREDDEEDGDEDGDDVQDECTCETPAQPPAVSDAAIQ
jgi:hypothetical protein